MTTSDTARIFARKAARRRSQASLPIEQKLKRLVKLQEMAFLAAKKAGRPAKKPWGKRAVIG